MSAIDVEALLKVISAEAPAGVDVEYDPAYSALERMAAGTPESVMGDEVKPAEEPDFAAVKKAALELLGRTRDLRVVMILAGALLKEDGLAGFRDGVKLMKGYIEKLWEQFYPKLDPSDNNDPTIRVNIFKGLDGDGSAADLFKFKQRVREAILTNSKRKVGRFCFRDIQMAKGDIPAPAAKEGEKAAPPPDIKLINAAFEDTATEDLQATQALLKEIPELLDGVDAALAARIGGGQGADMTGLKEILKAVKGAVDEQLARRGLGEAPVEAAAAGGGGEAGGVPRAGGRGVPISGEIASREDVVRMLDKICEYYARFEPTSPVPIFMQRAKRLVKMDFVNLIKDLAPEAMQQINIFMGAAEEPKQ